MSEAAAQLRGEMPWRLIMGAAVLAGVLVLGSCVGSDDGEYNPEAVMMGPTGQQATAEASAGPATIYESGAVTVPVAPPEVAA